MRQGHPPVVQQFARKLVSTLFDATGEHHAERPAEIRIGDSLVMVTPAGAREPFPAFPYVYVDDADAVIRASSGLSAMVRVARRSYDAGRAAYLIDRGLCTRAPAVINDVRVGIAHSTEPADR